ncbi:MULTISPECIES: ATP-binding protein [Ramlibacter]|uniref:ATP-binding protein n=1 Tax=Ramlibacter pinisoli TaxID=2682844 RepID=A0A6N8IMG5_9BURK|nr:MULTISPECIES: ATP-binding protein [Ramlibacter]MBA2960709.1 ATP-binding protein [Ramlibacter sp. CGMCC 1.13660]MVQ28037.1 ATP-binding protein [Ramlibacter pinisoli]
MLPQLLTFLGKNPGTKAKELAAFLGREKSAVNQVLYENSDKFLRDDDFKWSVICPQELHIELPGDSWLTTKDLENLLSRHCTPWHVDCESVIFVFGKECRMLLDALARLLALCNQLHAAGKKVSLDFTDCPSTARYLDRMDFFEVLASDIAVLPRRPRARLGALYMGNNDGVIELRAIDPAQPDNEIPRLLERSFVSCVDESYSTLALTVIGEPFKNVLDHSCSSLAGFAGLQAYKNRTRIQVVISDNGLGIVGTLQPILHKRYPEIAEKIEKSNEHSGIALLKKVFSTGQISQVAEQGRGAGLKSSGDQARKYSARISVRQQDFELRIDHRPEGTRYTPYTNLVRIHGTHISFDFKLDGSRISR